MHEDPVLKVEFSEKSGIFGSGCEAGKVCIWDTMRIGCEVEEDDNKSELFGPELLFTHTGHTSKVSDISFNPQDKLLLASCEEEINKLQVWKFDQSYLD